MSALSQEEVISNTKLLMQGLESLKTDTNQLINAAVPSENVGDQSTEDKEYVERVSNLKHSLESIEWGISEAQVTSKRIFCFHYRIFFISLAFHHSV